MDRVGELKTGACAAATDCIFFFARTIIKQLILSSFKFPVYKIAKLSVEQCLATRSDVCFLLSFSLFTLCKAQQLERVLFSPEQVASLGPRCLDGSPSGYYYAPGTVGSGFVIFLEGNQ